MKKTLFIIATVFTIIFFTACDDGNEATPDIVACFDYSPQDNLKIGDEIVFTNCSENATTFGWDFGNGDISTEENPTHSYESAGDYTVKMIAANENSADTISKTLSVGGNADNFITYNSANYAIPYGYYVHDADDESNAYAYWLLFCNSDSYDAAADDDVFSVTPYIRMDYIVSNSSSSLTDGKYYYTDPDSDDAEKEFTFIDGVFVINEDTYESITSGYFESTKIDETTYKIDFYFNEGTITGSYEEEFIFQE